MPDERSARAQHAHFAPKEDLQALIHETEEETLLALADLDCDLAQGYLISPPLEPAAMTHWLLSHPTHPTPELAGARL